MSLQFQTKSQQWLFTDPSVMPPVGVNPEDLLPLTTYTVYLVVDNPDPVLESGVVTITQGAFGIGLPGAVVATVPVTVPPAYFGVPGSETISFSYTSAAGGHGCLGAVIQPGGSVISQNTTVNTVAYGAPSNLSFLVFGGAAAETMVLTLTETVQGTGVVLPPGAADSWSPVMIAPPGTGGPENLATATLSLNLGAEAFDSVGLRVTVPAGSLETHVFHIDGTVNGADVGEVDIVVHGKIGAQLPPPDPYIMGGYQSADIILVDAQNAPVPLGGQPSGPWDTLLAPDTDYGFQALVHNDSATDAVNTIVRFWSIPGGVATAATLVDVQSATIPANSQVIVTSAHPFHSAPPLQHRCAAVTIANAQSVDFNVDTTSAAQLANELPGAVPDPHSGVAWRNTDSRWVFPGRPWSLNFVANLAGRPGVPGPGPVEVELAVATLRVPADIADHPRAVALKDALRSVGAQSRLPVFLAPSVRAELPEVDMKAVVAVPDGDRAVKGGRHKLHPGQDLAFAVHGAVPQTAKPGDAFLVEVNAYYPTGTVQFLEVLYVKG